jgi:hypothetical protein
MNKHAEYYENLDLFGCFGDQGSLEVAIGDHGSLEVAHILFFCFFLLFDCINMTLAERRRLTSTWREILSTCSVYCGKA